MTCLIIQVSSKEKDMPMNMSFCAIISCLLLLSHDFLAIYDVDALSLRFVDALTAEVIPAVVLFLGYACSDVIYARSCACHLEVVGIEVGAGCSVDSLWYGDAEGECAGFCERRLYADYFSVAPC